MTKLIAIAAIIAATCTACPWQKPNPFCPGICDPAPTTTPHH